MSNIARRGLVGLVLAILGSVAVSIPAQSIDNTCATCGRRKLDSLNIQVGPVRVNQVGYRTGDVQKNALVGSPRSSTFQVVRKNGTVAYSGTLKDLGTFPYKGRIVIRGFFNSITQLYKMSNTTNFDTADASAVERLWLAEFGSLTEEGTFRVAVGSDTSHPFEIRKTIYNDVFETSLKFFGWQRSGDNDAWPHGPSHMKDGSGRPGGAAKSGTLQGGWYDCGDYFKVGQTIGYSFTNLILAYSLWPQKAEDRYGSSYNDTLPFGNDGIPDLLREAKIGADYVMRLYRASLEDGMLATNQMYQDVGVWGNDHQYWDRPENADAAPTAKGGPDRPVVGAKGSAVPAQFAGSLALFSMAWEPFDPVFADSCLKAAKDIYARVVLPNWKVPGPGTVDGFYISQTRWDDDLAWAAANLWHATRDTLYKFHLMDDRTFGYNSGYVFNMETFRGGFMAMHASRLFSPGGWVMDYQNTHVHTAWLLYKTIYRTDSLAATWGIPAADAQDIRKRLRVLVGMRYAGESTNGNAVYPGTKANILTPYNLVWSSITWGMNRYNMGGLIPIVAYHEMIRDDSAAAAQPYLNLILDNMDYNLGRNPWDISFLMGAGSKNLQHPHNRIANPEGYNAGGIPYAYRSPKGALMGGAIPGQLLKDEWEKYDVTETCIDFSAQMVLPSQYLAQDLPPDNEGPEFSNVVVVQVTNTSALVSWETNELSRDTLFYSLTPGGPVVGKVVVNLAKKKSAEITGLQPDTKYWFFFKGMDIYRNVSRDDNRGRYYDFTTTTSSAPPAKITDVKVCNIRSDRATVFWWTDVPAPSAVEFAVEGADFATTRLRVDGDDDAPGRFHKVTLKGLKPGTTYRYDAISGSARSDSGTLHHRFTTIKDFANYTIQIKPTSKNGAGNAHFYMEVANNESKPYVGLELRLYFQTDAATASKIVVHGTDNAIFDVTGTMRPSSRKLDSIGPPVAVPGIANQWYLPIFILDTLPVAGRARLELKIDDSNWAPMPMSIFTSAWSLAPHAAPVPFGGVDLSWLWAGPDQVELRAGEPVVTYVESPYIAAYYQGVHIYGYPPDGAKPRVVRNTSHLFTKPLPSPATSVRQDSIPSVLGGRAWSWPDVVATQWQVDGPALRPSVPLAGQTDSVAFRHDTLEAQGANVHEFAFWGDRDSTYCSCSYSRYTVVVDTQKVLPPRYRLVWKPDTAVAGLVGTRIPMSVVLASDTLDTVKVAGTVSLVADKPGVQFFASPTSTTPLTALQLANGHAAVWVTSATALDSARIAAAGTVVDAVVDPALSGPVSFSLPPPWPLLDSAATADLDCDGAVDHVRLFLSGRPGANRLSSVAGILGTDSVRGVLAWGADSSRPVLTLAAPLPGTSRVGSMRLVWIATASGGRDTLVSTSVAVSDRIGPRLVSASVLENFRPATVPDTVRVEFSEPVVAPAAGWPFAAVAPASPVLSGGHALTPTVWEWIVAPGGAATVAAGQILRGGSHPGLLDTAGNAASGCGSDSALVALRTRPVPLVSGAVLDRDGDGRADAVHLRFQRGLRVSEMPDSVRLSWGGSLVVVPRAAWTRGADSSLLETVVSPSWPAAGPSGLGTAIKGSGASELRDSALLTDSVGPSLRGAMLRFGNGFDTLVANLSEGAAAPAGIELARLRSILSASSERLRSPAGTLRLVFPSGVLQDGDSLRLAAIWQDASNNPAAPAAPWIPLVSGDRPPVDAWLKDLDGDGRADQVGLRWDRPPRRAHGYVFSWPSGTAMAVRSVDSSAVVRVSPLEAVVTLSDPFPFGATGLEGLAAAPARQIEAIDGFVDSLDFAVRDSVDPVVVDAEVRYGAVDGAPDTLAARFSETLLLVPVQPQVLLHVRGPSTAEAPVVQWIVTQSADGRSAWLLLQPADSFQTRFALGDSVRVAPRSDATVRDGAGNVAVGESPWVKVRFGARPPRFSIAMYPSALHRVDPAAPVAGEQLVLLVRPRGDLEWRALEGPTPTDLAQRIGPMISINGPFGGRIHVYDNIGTSVASLDLSNLEAAVTAGLVEASPGGQYEVWAAWNGTSRAGAMVGSGVYTARMVLRRNLAAPGDLPAWTWTNDLIRFGWKISVQ